MFESAKISLKPGDAIVTAMGVGILSKKTRTYWYYIFKNRVARIRKSQLWEMVDIGSVEIKYGSNNKYRRLKTTNRSLNLSGLTNKKSVKFLNKFLIHTSGYLRRVCMEVFQKLQFSYVKM